MNAMTLIAALLGVIWGGVWALFLQFVPLGRFWAMHRTWVTVVVGVGVDLVILALVLPLEQWLAVAIVVAASSTGILIRSGWNEYQAHQAALDAADRTHGN